MTRILALDLARVMGAFWISPTGESQRFNRDLGELAEVSSSKRASSHGLLFGALEIVLFDLIKRSQPDVIAVEDDTGRNKKSAEVLAGYRAIVHLMAAKRGIRVIDDMKASDARTAAGVPGGNTKKEVAAAAARLLFKIPSTATDDEVDAEILHRAAQARLIEEALAERARFNRKRKPRTASYVDKLLAPTITRRAP